jgi:hypothetical protein
MTFAEWAAFYDKKNPEDPFSPTPGYDLYFMPDKGFCEVRFTETMAIIAQTAGDGRFFRDKVEEVARKLGIKEGGTICIRKEIRAYIRLFGYRVEREEKLPDGEIRYHARHRKTGKWFRASPAFRYKGSGELGYYVTWEI